MLARGAVFLINLICIRFLNQEDYGRLSIIRATANFIDGVLSRGVSPATIKTVSEQRDCPPIKPLIVVNLVTLVISVSVIVTCSQWITSSINTGISRVVFITLIILMITAIKVQSFTKSFMFGLEAYMRMAKTTLLSLVFSLPIAAFLTINYDLVGAVFGISLIFLLDGSVKGLVIYRGFYNQVSSSFSYSHFLSQSGAFIFAVVISQTAFWWIKVELAKCEGGLIELAIFEAAFQILTMVMIITGALTSILLPKLSSSKSTEGEKNKQIKLNVVINVAVVFSVFTVVYIFLDMLLSFFGEGYTTDEMRSVVMLMGIISLFFSLSSILHKIAISKTKAKIVIRNNVISSVVMLMAFYAGPSTALHLSYCFVIFYLSSCIHYLMENKFG